MMKRFLFLTMAALLMVSFFGCGLKQKAEEKMAEQFIESIGGGKVDLKDDSVTIKGEDGEAYTFGSAQWPTSKFAKSIPAFQAGKIESTLDSETYILISLADVKKTDYASYAEAVQKQFPEEAYSYETEGALSYSGSNKDAAISLTYDSEQSTLLISLVKSEAE